MSILLVVGFARAESPVGLYLGPWIGYQQAKGADHGNVWVGAVLRLRMNTALGLEGSINYRQEKFSDNRLTVRSWPVTASALFYPVPDVYGVAGIGWYKTTFDYDESRLVGNDRTEQKVGWHFGGGLELPISDRTNFTGDIRYVFIDYDFEDLPGSDDLSSNFFAITVGLLWELGGSD
jgi:opacity protein-like surface antigen